VEVKFDLSFWWKNRDWEQNAEEKICAWEGRSDRGLEKITYYERHNLYYVYYSGDQIDEDEIGWHDKHKILSPKTLMEQTAWNT
jgi:hypothetical protein